LGLKAENKCFLAFSGFEYVFNPAHNTKLEGGISVESGALRPLISPVFGFILPLPEIGIV
jgi:hypothetical protein